MWIKICGITRVDDALAAQDFGADAIGFVFAKSPRQISANDAQQISKHISITKVGVFVDSPLEEIRKIRQQCSLDFIQLHGNESPELCSGIPGAIKALSLQNTDSIRQIDVYRTYCRVLVDAWSANSKGGTGKQIQKHLLQQIAGFEEIILAGGLTPENVLDLIRQYNPFGVDVSSGVEAEKGIKDHRKLQQFIHFIRTEV